ITVERFHSDTDPQNVYSVLTDFMKGRNPDIDGGCVIFVTHKALFDTDWINKSEWHCVIDEIPNIDAEYSYNLSETETRNFIYDNFDAVECDSNNYLRVEIKHGCKSKIERWAHNKYEDSVLSVFAPMLQDVLCKHSEL